jgi:hypothetical protein
MFSHLTINDLFWLFLGLLLIIISGYVSVSMRMYPLAAGLLFLGIGSIFCAVTNGFTNPSPAANFLWKAGMIAFLSGLLLAGYGLFRFI